MMMIVMLLLLLLLLVVEHCSQGQNVWWMEFGAEIHPGFGIRIWNRRTINAQLGGNGAVRKQLNGHGSERYKNDMTIQLWLYHNNCGGLGPEFYFSIYWE